MKKITVITGLALMTVSSLATAAQLEVKITNNAPSQGTYLTPAWVGFHDGTFNAFDSGSAASTSLESLAEDGNASALSADFNAQQTTGIDGSVGGLYAPGSTFSETFTVSSDGSNSYFSFAAMLLPSSDFFIGNDSAFDISGLLDGSLSSISFDIASVYDAGTEVNDFTSSAGNGLFGISGGQTGPNQGADENSVVSVASGLDYALFLNVAGIDTDRFNFSNYDSIATIEISNVSEVPVPAAMFLFGPALLGFIGLRRKSIV